MDRTDRVFDEITRGIQFRAALGAGPEGQPYEPQLPPLWRVLALDAARAAGAALLYLLGLCIMAGLLGALAAAARIGWELGA